MQYFDTTFIWHDGFTVRHTITASSEAVARRIAERMVKTWARTYKAPFTFCMAAIAAVAS